MLPYTGQEQDRRYTGGDADVTYSLKRCIHAEECISRLGPVFDRYKRPWIQPAGATADEVSAVVALCPSGALHVERKDGGLNEQPPAVNRVILREDDPLQISGDFSIHGTNVAIEHETRATLCRCGASQNKPFCDNTHRQSGFSGDARVRDSAGSAAVGTAGKLQISAQPDGPLVLNGAVRIADEYGVEFFVGEETKLCRCGASKNKPFCDGTHNAIGFEAE